MTALEYAAKCTHPVVWYATPSKPLGIHIALLEETDLPFELADLTGEEVDGRWIADNLSEGEKIDGWKFRDHSGEIIKAVQLVDNREEWMRQKADYDAIT